MYSRSLDDRRCHYSREERKNQNFGFTSSSTCVTLSFRLSFPYISYLRPPNLGVLGRFSALTFIPGGCSVACLSVRRHKATHPSSNQTIELSMMSEEGSTASEAKAAGTSAEDVQHQTSPTEIVETAKAWSQG